MDTAIKTPDFKVEQSPNAELAEIKRIYDLQQANKQNVKNTSARERRDKLNKMKRKIFAMREEIQQALLADFRKPAAETDLTEIYPVLTELRHAISHVGEWMRPTIVDTPMSYFGSSAKVVYEPKGVTLIMSPWNYPFNLCLIPLVSAIAAGNTAIIKPSEYTPNTSRVTKKLLEGIFDENEVAVVEGDYTVAAELVKLKFDHIFFTGSPSVGKIVMRAAADHLASVTLELGGKSPVVIDESANVAEASKKITWGKFLNNGQTCVAPDYLLVHESKKDAFLSQFKKDIAAAYGDTEEARKASPDYCRIINQKHFYRVSKLIEDAVEKGANVEIGGSADETENYIAPTILTNVTSDMEIMDEEIFGPVIPLLTYSDINDALEMINGKEKPLAMYIFSNRQSNVDKLMQNTSAGGTVINDVVLHVNHPNLPFGGANNSGIGNAHGLYGFKAFSHERAVMKQLTRWSAAQNMYPPYKGMVQKMIDFTLKYF